MGGYMKKFLALCMSAILVLGIVGCGADEVAKTEGEEKQEAKQTNETKSESEEVKEVPEQKRPVKMLTSVVGGNDPDEMDLWNQEAERLSGIQIEATRIAGDEYNTKLTTTLASGEEMDILYMNTDAFEKLLPLNAFETLTKRIEESEVLGNSEIIDPTEWDRIRRDDGEIYAIFNKYEGGRLPLVRKDWLDQLGLEEPGDLDGYYEMLKAFTYNDPDGNGQDDTYGFTLKKTYDIQPFMGTKGLVDGYDVDENGQLYVPYATEDAIEVYDWLAKLYEEGIMDPNFPTNGSSDCREMILTGRAGLMVYWDNWTGLFNEKALAEDPNTSFEIYGLEPPKGANGEGSITTGQDGVFTILNYSDNIDWAFKFLEFYHTYEGNILSTLGIEGHDYTMEDGKYVLTEVGQQHSMDHGVVVAKSLQWVNPVKIPKNYEQSRDVVLAYGKPELLNADSKAVEEIVDKNIIKAILGEITGEEAVANMQKELKGKGLID